MLSKVKSVWLKTLCKAQVCLLPLSHNVPTEVQASLPTKQNSKKRCFKLLVSTGWGEVIIVTKPPWLDSGIPVLREEHEKEDLNPKGMS